VAVAYDAFANSAAAASTRSWTHTPVGTPRGVIVWVIDIDGDDDISTVTYGGVSMTQVSASPAVLTTGETGAVHCFFLGSSIPTGAQTVVATAPTGTGGVKVGYSVTLTAAADTEVVDSDAINSASVADPSVVLALAGRTSWAGLALYSGHDALTGITPLLNWTGRIEQDAGTEGAACYTYNTVSTADVTAGWTQTAEDAVAVAVAVSEVAGGVLAGTADLTFGAGNSTLTGAGALAGVADGSFGAGSSTLTGTCALAGAAVLAFAAGSSTLTASGSLAGTGALEFGAGSATLTGAGALAGSTTITFTVGATTGSVGVLVGSAALTFTGSALVLGSGALAGAADLVFAATLNNGTSQPPAVVFTPDARITFIPGARDSFTPAARATFTPPDLDP